MSFLADTRGATAIEYAMIAGGVALVVVAAVDQVGQVNLTNKFNQIAGAL